jgi:hypothetical protein
MDEPKITWRFTVKNGCVNHMSPQAPVKLQKDEDGKPFFRFPLPYPGTDKKIKKTFAVATPRASTAKASTTKRATLSSSRQRW